MKTRRLILEQAGHKVISVSDEKALLSACEKHRFDVAVVGQTVSLKMKRHIGAIVRKSCPTAKILELYQAHTGKVIDDADSWLVVPSDVPKDLADRVTELAQRGDGTKA